MGDDILVALYRCTHCGVRMFEERTADHLQRQHPGVEVSVRAFVRGPRDTYPRPGGQVVAYGRVRLAKGSKRPARLPIPPDDDPPEMLEEEPVLSLTELVES